VKTRDTSLFGLECKCPQCKKAFIKPSPEWGYQARVKTQLRCFCSWSCLRKWQAAHTISGQAKKRREDDGADQQAGGNKGHR